VLTGSATASQTAVYGCAGTGSLALAGAAGVSRGYIAAGSGSLAVGGAAVTSFTSASVVDVYTASGSLTITGAAFCAYNVAGATAAPGVASLPSVGLGTVNAQCLSLTIGSTSVAAPRIGACTGTNLSPGMGTCAAQLSGGFITAAATLTPRIAGVATITPSIASITSAVAATVRTS
jgi:hypothetical protein